MIAVAKVPLAGDDSGHTIIAVRVRLDGGVRGHEQQDGVEARFCRIAKDDLRMNPGNGRTQSDYCRARWRGFRPASLASREGIERQQQKLPMTKQPPRILYHRAAQT